MGEIKIDKIIRSARKTIALVVMRDASLVVRAPYNVSYEYIEKLAFSKSDWILKKQKSFAQRAEVFKPKKYEHGEEFYLLGNKYKLEIVEGVKPAIWIDNSLKMTSGCLASPQKFISRWYINQAKEILNERVKKYSIITGFSYKSVRINSAKTRWGSCGPKNTLNFSWRLVIAPIDVIDSVVVHELVHTEIKNHSRKFYHKLKSFIPDFKEREKWLKDNTGAFLL